MVNNRRIGLWTSHLMLQCEMYPSLMYIIAFLINIHTPIQSSCMFSIQFESLNTVSLCFWSGESALLLTLDERLVLYSSFNNYLCLFMAG